MEVIDEGKGSEGTGGASPALLLLPFLPDETLDIEFFLCREPGLEVEASPEALTFALTTLRLL